MVEHWSEKPGVDSSILSLGISFLSNLPHFVVVCRLEYLGAIAPLCAVRFIEKHPAYTAGCFYLTVYTLQGTDEPPLGLQVVVVLNEPVLLQTLSNLEPASLVRLTQYAWSSHPLLLL